MGEVYSNLQCNLCAHGTFSFDTRPTDLKCRDCPEGAVCLGSSMIMPQDGFYHASLISENFQRCGEHVMLFHVEVPVLLLCHLSDVTCAGAQIPVPACFPTGSSALPALCSRYLAALLTSLAAAL